MFEYILAGLAYGAIIVAVILFLKGSDSNCTQECNQGRTCDCKDEK